MKKGLNTMNKVLFVLVLVLSISKVSANEPENKPAKVATNQIEGTVADLVTSEALVGVCLKLKGSDKKTYTDLKGNFKIEGVTQGTYDIEIEYVSYKDITLKNVSTSSPKVKLKVELESAVQAL